MIWGAAVTQLRQMGGSVSGRTSLVRGSNLAVDVGVERSWRSHVEVFQQLARFGEIPRKVAKIATPKCAGCIYGAMTKVPWRTHQQQKNEIFVATRPGECVSINKYILNLTY